MKSGVVLRPIGTSKDASVEVTFDPDVVDATRTMSIQDPFGKTEKINVKDDSFVVKGLPQNSRYIFCVLFRASYINRADSLECVENCTSKICDEVSTTEGQPPKPESPTITAFPDKNTISIKWHPMSEKVARGRVLFYNVKAVGKPSLPRQGCASQPEHIRHFKVPANITHLTLDALRASHTYKVYLQAENGVFSSEWSFPQGARLWNQTARNSFMKTT